MKSPGRNIDTSRLLGSATSSPPKKPKRKKVEYDFEIIDDNTIEFRDAGCRKGWYFTFWIVGLPFGLTFLFITFGIPSNTLFELVLSSIFWIFPLPFSLYFLFKWFKTPKTTIQFNRKSYTVKTNGPLLKKAVPFSEITYNNEIASYGKSYGIGSTSLIFVLHAPDLIKRHPALSKSDGSHLDFGKMTGVTNMGLIYNKKQEYYPLVIDFLNKYMTSDIPAKELAKTYPMYKEEEDAAF